MMKGFLFGDMKVSRTSAGWLLARRQTLADFHRCRVGGGSVGLSLVQRPP